MEAPDLLRVLVGPDYREFVVHRGLLCASSPFFRDSIDAVPEGLTSSPSLPLSPSPPSSPSSPSPPSPPLSSPGSSPGSASKPGSSTLIWLAGESADVFELFVLWLYRRHAFRAVVDDAVTILAREATPDEVITLLPRDTLSDNNGLGSGPGNRPDNRPGASATISDLHWHLVHLHLFAALVDIPVLQDAVMDALQDLYLRFDWAATPALLRFLYVDADADPFAAFRLRKWAVALLTWTIANARSPALKSNASTSTSDAHALELLRLLLSTPQMAADYDAHRAKMRASRADARVKNPQLRIASNQLRREDRHFGFRQCSFHSHRRTAGEGRCPHERERRRKHTGFVGSSVPVAESAPAVLSTAATAPANVHSAGVKASRRPEAPAPAPAPAPSFYQHSPSSSVSSTSSEPRLVDLPTWSPLSVTTPGYAPLGMESTI